MTHLCAAAALVAAAASFAISGDARSGDAQRGRMLETVLDISAAVRACWRVPDGLRGFERLEATVRFSLRADGTVQGEERVSFAALPPDTRARDLLARSARDAVRTCQPFNIAAGLGRAVAGRVFAVRLIYRGPPGRGA